MRNRLFEYIIKIEITGFYICYSGLEPKKGTSSSTFYKRTLCATTDKIEAENVIVNGLLKFQSDGKKRNHDGYVLYRIYSKK